MLQEIKSLLNKARKDIKNINSDFSIDIEIETYMTGYLSSLYSLKRKKIPKIWYNQIDVEIKRFLQAMETSGTKEHRLAEYSGFDNGYIDALNIMYYKYCKKNNLEFENLKYEK